MAKIIGKMKRVETNNQPVQEEKKVLKCLQGFDTSHLVDESNETIYEININDIKERNKNNFIKSNIEELAKSIKEIGLQQPIVVKAINKDEEGNQLYEVIAGHRRLSAYSLLANEIGETEFVEDNPYLKIKARIIKDNEDDNKIYLQTNSNTRNTTLIEAILNCDLEEINFNNPEFKDKYNNLFYPDSKIPTEEKYNNNSEVKYIERMVKDNFPNLEDISTKSVRNVYALIQRLDVSIIQAILNGTIGVKKANLIARYPKEHQEAVLKELEFGNPFPSSLSEFLPRIEEQPKTEPTQKSSFQDLLKIDKRLKAFTEINLDNLETDDWTANSKAYLKQMNKVLAEIKKLEQMPKK